MFRSGPIVAIVLLAIATAAPAAAMAPFPTGLWMNPHSSVVVRAGPCGSKLCGWVVWADERAKMDARDGGVATLIGTELLQDYAGAGPNAWEGTVFVPDRGRRFSSTIQALSPDRLKISGCILGGLICRSQIWTRIEHLPRE